MPAGAVARPARGRPAAKRAVTLVLGTAFAVLAGLLVLLVSVRTLELVSAPPTPVPYFVVGSLGALAASLYTSICLRIELDLAVVLPATAIGTVVLVWASDLATGLGGAAAAYLATSLANSAGGWLVTERFRWIGTRFVAMAHNVQSAFLVGSIAWSFYDMSVRAALAAFGLIAWIGWHPALVGGCALTLVEARLDAGRRAPELAERGFIVCQLKRRFGVRVSPAAFDRFVYSAALLLYGYWLFDLLS